MNACELWDRLKQLDLPGPSDLGNAGLDGELHQPVSDNLDALFGTMGVANSDPHDRWSDGVAYLAAIGELPSQLGGRGPPWKGREYDYRGVTTVNVFEFQTNGINWQLMLKPNPMRARFVAYNGILGAQTEIRPFGPPTAANQGIGLVQTFGGQTPEVRIISDRDWGSLVYASWYGHGGFGAIITVFEEVYLG